MKTCDGRSSLLYFIVIKLTRLVNLVEYFALFIFGLIFFFFLDFPSKVSIYPSSTSVFSSCPTFSAAHLAIHPGSLRSSPRAVHPVLYALDGRGRAAFKISLASSRLRGFGGVCSEDRDKKKK